MLELSYSSEVLFIIFIILFLHFCLKIVADVHLKCKCVSTNSMIYYLRLKAAETTRVLILILLKITFKKSLSNFLTKLVQV